MHRRTLIGAVAACACVAAALPAAASAQTVAVPLSFNHLVLDTQATGDAQVVTPSTQPATATAELDPSTNAFTVSPSDFSAPTYTFTSPASGSITLSLADTASGQLTSKTGGLTLTGKFQAVIDVPSLGGECTIVTPQLTLSTSTTKPLDGQDFPAGTGSFPKNDAGYETGAGAFGAGWSTLPAGTGPSCSTIDAFIDGPGGIWVSRNISPIPANLTLTAKAPKSVKAGKKAPVIVEVSNTGGNPATGVKVCVKAPKPLKAPKCQSISTLAPGASKTLTFKVSTDKKKHGTYTLKVTASGKGTAAKKSVKLKVTKK